MPNERINQQQEELLPAHKILDTTQGVYGKFLVHGSSYNVAGDLITMELANHKFVSGQSLIVEGADDANVNGAVTITVIDANTFSYTPSSAPANPDGLADVPLTGEILVGDTLVSGTFNAATALQVILSNGASAEVEIAVDKEAPWMAIVATLSGDGAYAIEFPVPYNFSRVRGVDSGGDVVAYGQGMRGSPI